MIDPQAHQALVNADYQDIFGLLGLHYHAPGQWVVRAFLPTARRVEVVSPLSEDRIAEMQDLGENVFAAIVNSNERFGYRLKVHYDDTVVIKEDPYRFGSTISEHDLYLFGEGTHETLYNWLGAHAMEIDGVPGVRFAVWAPNARRVAVVGDFNFWDGRQHAMRKLLPSGVWELFIPGLQPGDIYKYELKSAEGYILPLKTDPLAFATEQLPGTASRVSPADDYQWQDGDWMQSRWQRNNREGAISIYEVHLGSWRRKLEDGNRYLTYRELADELVDYVRSMGFTHVQLMPVSEYPFDGSWGYQPIGLFAPTSRFGSVDDFKYFVDRCHQAEIGVLIDWVPGHFPSDSYGLARFDGTALYEHADDRQGFHPDWNTYIYNYGRREVANFLFSNALFWMDRYHIDGLRVDAVASMLYLDYSRQEGQWIANCYGGRENLEAIDLLKRVNTVVYQRYPDAMTVAEESTAWPGVSHPVYLGGLGFGFKWNMGWMNDTLRYMAKDPIHRQFHHHDMTFSLLYSFNENFILPLSHDEVVHGKRSLLDRMPGDGQQKFDGLRAYFGYMWTHPGKKLLFMGGEFAQGREWNYNTSLDWHLLEVGYHRGTQNLIRDLNRLYVNEPALYETDCESDGFEWIEADDRHNSVFAYARKTRGGRDMIIVVCHLTPMTRDRYRLGVPREGVYEELLNTSSADYIEGGWGELEQISSEPVEYHGRSHSIVLTIPSLSTRIFRWRAA